MIVGLVAFAVAGCAAADCAAKLAAIREFYASDSDCQGVVAVLDKETACTDSDKDLLGSCLKVSVASGQTLSTEFRNNTTQKRRDPQS